MKHSHRDHAFVGHFESSLVVGHRNAERKDECRGQPFVDSKPNPEGGCNTKRRVLPAKAWGGVTRMTSPDQSGAEVVGLARGVTTWTRKEIDI